MPESTIPTPQNITIDVQAYRAAAKRQWLKENTTKVSFAKRIGNSTEWWLIAIALVFFLLSAPHTAAIFNQITPFWGNFAPVAIEFGLLYAAFRRKHLSQTNGTMPKVLRVLEVLLFVVSILVNGAGALITVSEMTGIANLSVSAIWNAYPTLPVTSQVALFLVPLAALIIPIGTAVSGEGFASLVLEERLENDERERRWVGWNK